MSIVNRTVTLNVIEDRAEAKEVAAMLLADYFGSSSYERDAANGALEAFFVSYLREVPKDTLGSELESLKAEFGKLNAFKRAVERVKSFRSKNPAWRTFNVA
jgi:hypothetical protein